MSAVVDCLTEIDYSYDKTGEVQCRNTKGLIFFLQAEPPSMKGEAKAETRPATPAPTAPAWQPMESVVEVEVRRAAEPMPIAEATRRHTEAPAEARQIALPKASHGAQTGPLPEAPAPGKQAEKGWFGKLFK